MTTHFDDTSTFRIHNCSCWDIQKALSSTHSSNLTVLPGCGNNFISAFHPSYWLTSSIRTRSRRPLQCSAQGATCALKGRPQGSSVVVVRHGDGQRPLLQISRWPRGDLNQQQSDRALFASLLATSLSSDTSSRDHNSVACGLCNVLLLAPSTVARRGAEIVVKTLELMCGQKLAGSCQRHGTRNPHAGQIGTSMWG